MHYISTFPAGFEAAVKKYMTSKRQGEYTIEQLESGFVHYSSAVDYSKLARRPIFTNTFLVIASLGSVASLKRIRPKINASIRQISIPDQPNLRTFKLLILNENEPTALPDSNTIRYMLGKQLRLQHVSHHPDCEIILMRRSDGQTFLLLRTYHAVQKSKNGELSESTAALLCVTAGVQKNETVLDPFAGHGSIPFACAAYFNPKKVVALEKDMLLANQLRSLLPQKCVAYHQDITELEPDNKIFSPHSIDRIVTDPPWGSFDKSIDLASIYQSLASLCDSALRKFGTATILTAKPKLLTESFAKFPQFKLKNKNEVLVSGKKATVITFQKK